MYNPNWSDGSWLRGEATWELGFLRTYPITIFVGFLLAFLSVAYFWKRMKYPWEILQVMLIIIVPSAILGARFWFVAAQGGWSNFFQFEGLSIHGGVLFAVAAVTPYVYSKRKVVDFRTAFGIVLPNILIGQAIGRFGNMDNHEVYGKIIESSVNNVNDSTLDWMGVLKGHMWIRSTLETDMIIDGVTYTKGTTISAYRLPFFLIEFITSFSGWCIISLTISRKNWLKPGVTGGIYLIWYGIIRIPMELNRDSVDIMTWGKMPISVFIAALSLVGGLAIAIYWQFFSKKQYDRIEPVRPRKKVFVNMANNAHSIIGTIASPFVPKKYQSKFLEWKKIKLTKEERYKYFQLFGPKQENLIPLWIPHNNPPKWSKKELNQGFKNDSKQPKSKTKKG